TATRITPEKTSRERSYWAAVRSARFIQWRYATGRPRACCPSTTLSASRSIVRTRAHGRALAVDAAANRRLQPTRGRGPAPPGGGGGAGAVTTWGFNLSHRIGAELLGYLERGQKVVMRAVVKTTEYDADMQVPTAVIKGDGWSKQEVVITGHLFEGIAKQGAMDDASGSAAALEVGRAWVKLIQDGLVPRPRRTGRFLWIA